MRVMVLVKATEDSEKGFVPTPEMTATMEAMGRFNDELRQGRHHAGDCDGLKPSSQGKRVAFDGPAAGSSTGRSPRPSELVAGYWLWTSRTWTRRSPG